MRIVVLGCGYVGIELGRQLVDRGHDVVGVRRSTGGVDAIEHAGFDGVRGDLTDPDDVADLPDADALVFAASSGGRGADAAREVYVDGLQTALGEYATREDAPRRIVYTSSTGVFGDHDGDWVDETTPIGPTTAKTRVLASAEAVALAADRLYGIDGTVARFAGLYGPDRYRLSRYVDGPVTEGYLNMVHRDDAAGAVRYLLETDRGRGDVVHVADDEPVAKWTFADWLADECGESAPEKVTTSERLADGDLSAAAERRIRAEKRVDNARLRDLGYEFRFPTFREGYERAVDDYRHGDA
ncbi:NAD-dependent epimerase/dehydratase family protein [Halorubellus sp. JP-L1]|uniref:NAD-dependent epimerase/dehydratase family protein n=1 Tax=Halorubellus sp. JP-L1 TaxID=2715753 RepID=UPI00140BA30B|nr:NAD-dependent epimerase/dehydratase family protein [Halorubellus sp. JP-L1]NHN42271.1 NAD-dependent epimerase/dehydratase family protein [Halorubellus sp. JP-L1]